MWFVSGFQLQCEVIGRVRRSTVLGDNVHIDVLKMDRFVDDSANLVLEGLVIEVVPVY